MRRIVSITLMVIGLLALCSQTTWAQTSTSTAQWNQGNTLADAKTFTYKLQDGSGIPVAISNVACSQVAAVVLCTGTIPQPAAGPHSFLVLATSQDGALTATSLPTVGVMPASPNGVRVTVTVTTIITP